MIQFKSKLTKSLYKKRFNLIYLDRYFLYVLLSFFIFIILGFLLLFLNKNILGGVICFIFSFLISTIHYAYLYFFDNNNYNNNPLLLATPTLLFTFLDEGIRITYYLNNTKAYEYFYYYNTLNKVTFKKGIFLLWVSKADAIPFREKDISEIYKDDLIIRFKNQGLLK